MVRVEVLINNIKKPLPQITNLAVFSTIPRTQIPNEFHPEMFVNWLTVSPIYFDKSSI